MLQLNWIKSTNNTWLPFETFNIEGCVTNPGVYLIWHPGQPSRVVRVGQGDVKARLSDHRNDNEISAYRVYGTLMVTWASVPARSLDGVERYLAEYWKPLVGDRFPDVVPIPVNSPFA